MNRFTRIIVYSFTAFMIAFGFDFLLQGNITFHTFQNTVFVYSLASMLFIRHSFQWIWPRKTWYKILGVIIAYYIFFISFRYILEEVLVANIIGYGNYNPNTTVFAYIKDNIYYGSIHFMFGLIIYLIDKQIENQRKQAALLANYHKAELDFLRLQISPHFLFNALNSIYALAYKKSEKTPDAILQLSDLMRYMLYEKSEKIELRKEWEMSLNYIELQKLRIKQELPLVIKVRGDLNHAKIPPYTLIPFLENAFKHGDFSDNNPLIIDLNLEKGKLAFVCKNKRSKHERHTQHGIGINNIRKRLDIFYPKQYDLILNTTPDDVFVVQLYINLNL